MTNYDRLIADIETLENQAYSNEFDTSKFLLSEKEVVKKILKIKNPQLTDDEISYIVDNEDEILKREEEKTNREEAKKKKTKNNKEDKKKETEEEKRKREQDQQKAKEERRAQTKQKIAEYKRIFAEKIKQLYEEAKELLREIKAAIFRLIKGVKDLTKRFVTTTIQTFSSIPAITLMISAPPWNIPGAISLSMLVAEAYLSLLALTKDIIPFLSPLRKLVFVTDKKNLSALSAILNVPIKILLALWAPIMAIGELVQKLIQKLLDIMKFKGPSVFKKATAKLRSLGHIPHNPETIKVAGIELKPYGDRRSYTINGISLHAYSAEDAEEVADLLSIFKLNTSNQSNPQPSSRVVAYRETLVDDLKGKLESLNDQLSNPELNFPDTTNVTDRDYESKGSFVFDVELPDGSKLYGISEEQLEELKLSYNVVMKELQILETAASVDDNKIASNLLNFSKLKVKESKTIDFVALTDTSILSPSISSTVLSVDPQLSSSITFNTIDVSAAIDVSTLSQNFNFFIR
jgi:hypothetical protein